MGNVFSLSFSLPSWKGDCETLLFSPFYNKADIYRVLLVITPDQDYQVSHRVYRLSEILGAGYVGNRDIQSLLVT
jgi:hypothetical protein